jgi:anti-sigma-K factor RskA
MSQFDRDLRESLRRRQPVPGFAEQVIARARAREKRRALAAWRWVAVAAMVVLMVGGFALVREQRRQAEGERNKEQLIAALQITSSKLNRIQGRLSTIQQRIRDLRLEQQQ